MNSPTGTSNWDTRIPGLPKAQTPWDGRNSQAADPNNPMGLLRSRGPSGPYQSGLRTDFSGAYTANDMGDADVRGAQGMYNELKLAQSGSTTDDARGVDQAADGAMLNMYKARIGIKNSLGESINNNAGQENLAEQNVRQSANQAIGSGVDNTRDNYNSRGLLYSGMREGGENQVRNQGAAEMASGIAGTRQDYGNALSSAQNAYASVDLANQQDTLNRANQAFDTANQNNIARLQAMQQLGGGIGTAAGTIAGHNWGPGGSSGGTTAGAQSAQDVQNWMSASNTGYQGYQSAQYGGNPNGGLLQQPSLRQEGA